MWKKLLQLWEDGALRRAAHQNGQARTKITLAGQKWFGPGECLRIVEIEAEGGTHKIAIWNGKASSQMVELGGAVQFERPSTLPIAAGGGVA